MDVIHLMVHAHLSCFSNAIRGHPWCYATYFNLIYGVACGCTIVHIVAQCFMQNELKWAKLKIHALASFVCVAVHQSAACSQSRHDAAVQLCCILVFSFLTKFIRSNEVLASVTTPYTDRWPNQTTRYCRFLKKTTNGTKFIATKIQPKSTSRSDFNNWANALNRIVCVTKRDA